MGKRDALVGYDWVTDDSQRFVRDHLLFVDQDHERRDPCRCRSIPLRIKEVFSDAFDKDKRIDAARGNGQSADLASNPEAKQVKCRFGRRSEILLKDFGIPTDPRCALGRPH
ncbi:hypothetical protein ASC90_05710 [Rhizobium sp. Root1220]|nr:hypothetical protein ASC90_05710 [Rhizobium sp. Root1220]